MVEGTPPGDALPPSPQRATPARKGARCGAGAESPRPHRPHPGHTGRGTLAARSRGRAAGGGTAPDTRHPSQRWQAPPPGTPFRHLHSEQRRPARAHAVGPVLGPHARTDRTRDTRVAEPWLPAPEDGRPGEGQRLTPGAPHNGGRPSPPGTAPHHPRGTQPPQGMQAKGTVLSPHTHTPAPTAREWRTPTARPVGGQSGEGQRLTSDAPHTMVEGTPPGDALPPPPQRAKPARKGAHCGPGAGSPRPHRPHPGQTGRGTPASRSRGRAAGGGTAPDSRHPSQRWQATPPRYGPPPPPRHAAPTGHAGRGESVGPPHPHACAHSTPVAGPDSPPSGQAVGGGTAPDLRRPSQWWKAPLPGTPFRRPHSEQCRPARAHAVQPVLGPHARTDRTRDTRVAVPWLPAPEDGRPREGQRLTPDAPHSGGRPPPRGPPPTTPAARSPHRACRPRGQYWAPTPTHPRPQHVVGGPQQPAQWEGQSGEGRRLISDAPHNGGRHPPRGRPSAAPTASNAGPQGRTLWGRCWVPTPAPTAPRTHGSRNSGCLLQRTGGRGRDSA